MKSLKNNQKGFSFVELLAVVVILGILAALGVGVTSSLIDKAKKDKVDSQKNTITSSAQSYLQDNKNLVPKIIGETKVIRISDLRAAKYLTEDITNEKGESCMDKSFVRVYKLSNTEYTYTTFLYCGDEEIPAEQDVPTPKITAKFSDSSGDLSDQKLNNVSDAYLFIEINAATDDEIADYKSQGTQIAIDGYAFKIFVYKGSKKVEAYNSGSLSGGREEKIIINKKLNDYIDVTNVTEISLEVIAINTIGGVTNTTTTVGEHGETSSSVYDDNVPPKCVKPDSPYAEGDWLNKREYNTTKLQRKLTVGCDDGTGSGCIRNYFTMSWPNDDDKLGAEYVYIEVKDNAGNVSLKTDECKFRVNVDIQTPEATITAYSGQPSTSTTIPNVTISSTGGGTTKVPSNPTHILANKIAGKSSILTKSVSVNDSKTSATINSVDYKNLISNTTDVKWMNKENYPAGVVYRIDLKDNIRLDKWTWETNEGYINDTKSKKYKSVSVSNPDGSSGSVEQDEAHGLTIFHGSTADTIFVQFLTEGMRYGVFTIYDKAGNSTKITISANLDRTPPPVPSDIIAYQYNKVRTEGTTVSKTKYTFGTWINKYVQVKTAGGQNRDDLTQGVTLSGFWQFYYDARNNANTRVGTADYATNSLGIGIYDFKGTASEVDGKNKIRFMGCDKAGNCSDWSSYKDVWIDITVPQCSVSRNISGSLSSSGWLGLTSSGGHETATVTATCKDPTDTLASGCSTSSFSHTYSSEINTSTAGAKGNNNGGSFTDNAGNSVSCAANQTVKIDYHRPTCKTSGGSTSWTNGNRTVTGTCSDTGGSGCVGNISHTYTTNTNTSSAGPAGVNNGGYVYDKADNAGACAADRPVYIDKTPPYVTYSPDPSVTYKDNSGKDVTAICNDTGGSGLSNRWTVTYDAHMPSPNGGRTGIGKCCEDNAGNITCDTAMYSIMHKCEHSSCGVKDYMLCRTGGCGVQRYDECTHSDCGQYVCGTQNMTAVPSQKAGTHSVATNVNTCYSVTEVYCQRDYISCSCYFNGSRCVCSYPTVCPSGYRASGSSCIKPVNKYCNKSCRTAACGVDIYNECRHSECGVEHYNTCWHLDH